MNHLKLRLFALGTLIAFLISCASSDDRNADTAEGAFKIAEELEKDERYEEAITKFSELKNKYPYSKFATSAELKIADIQFARENFIEAQNAYQIFRELHPKHPQIHYVIFRTGMSYFNQLPSTIDRDLSMAYKAIDQFDELTKNFPSSEHVLEAKEKKQKSRKMLAEKELYIANFYFKKDQFDSALKRYENLLKNYPTEGLTEKALYGAGVSALEIGEREQGKKFLGRLTSEFSTSDEAGKAKDAYKKFGIQ